MAEQNTHVTFHFQHKLIHLDIERNELVFDSAISDTPVQVKDAHLICGCDGAYSVVRKSLMKQTRIDYSQQYIEHGYMELKMLPKNDKYAMEPNVFHLWPRSTFMLVASSNKNKSFTGGLLAPFSLFEEKLSSDQEVLNFFTEEFPDALDLIGKEEVQRIFREHRPASMVSIKCSPHHFGDRYLLMGDAAHAMVPFYGQGMNCGFEDCLVLSNMLDKHQNNIGAALRDYSSERCVDAHACNDLSMHNYIVLRDSVDRRWFKIQNALDDCLHRLLPSKWMPLDSMVTFSRIRYHQAIQRKQWQDHVVQKVLRGVALFGVGAAVVLLCIHKRAVH